MRDNSEVIAVTRQNGGWVWSISTEDPLRNCMKLVRQSARALQTYEAAMAEAQSALADVGGSA
jgi:NaMN:DMB phosphoribosyltransferase